MKKTHPHLVHSLKILARRGAKRSAKQPPRLPWSSSRFSCQEVGNARQCLATCGAWACWGSCNAAEWTRVRVLRGRRAQRVDLRSAEGPGRAQARVLRGISAQRVDLRPAGSQMRAQARALRGQAGGGRMWPADSGSRGGACVAPADGQRAWENMRIEHGLGWGPEKKARWPALHMARTRESRNLPATSAPLLAVAALACPAVACAPA